MLPDFARALAGLVASAAEPVLLLLDPPRCAGCDAPLGSPAVFCGCCLESVLPLAVGPPRPPGISRLAAFGEYGGALGTALRRFKYQARPELARPLGTLAAMAARGATGELIVPVPLHPKRLAERGYNQAALLARSVSAALGGSLACRTLERRRLGVPQARLARAQRLAEVRGAFAVRSRTVAGRSIVLVDDVTTTGATLAACAEALLEAGASNVEAVVVAWAV